MRLNLHSLEGDISDGEEIERGKQQEKTQQSQKKIRKFAGGKITLKNATPPNPRTSPPPPKKVAEEDPEESAVSFVKKKHLLARRRGKERAGRRGEW